MSWATHARHLYRSSGEAKEVQRRGPCTHYEPADADVNDPNAEPGVLIPTRVWGGALAEPARLSGD